MVAAMTLLSRISGLIRDIALAYLFGASVVADLFFIAFRVPNVFRRLFAEGAFSQAFVPVLMDYRHRGPVELKLFLAHLSTKFVGILSVVVVLGVVFSAALAGLFAPGLLDSPNEFALVTELLRITFPYLGFISLTAYAGALFNAHGYFALPAITPVMLNLCLIVAAGIALAGVFEAQPVIIVAWGVMAAGIVQMTMQLPLLAKLDLMPAPRIGHHEGLAQVRSLLIPALLANSVGQINTLINTILASTLIAGSISWLYYADRLLELPIGLVAVALGTVLLPHLSAMVVQGNPQRFQRTLNWGITLGVGLGLPAAVALYLLAEPLLAVIYLSLPGSAMTVADIQMAGAALQLFAIALPGFVLVKIFSPAFFANKDSKTPLRCAVTGGEFASGVKHLPMAGPCWPGFGNRRLGLGSGIRSLRLFSYSQAGWV